ncbi:MAG: hypothetical protein C5B51_00480 [Terriglobia bacterium]|nr:MAG: hypothetical protein C5B51_00480 [Terriglobia bacterium]
MRRLYLLLLFCGILLSGAELPGVRTVYFLPMARGLDQYLANRITSDHVFKVVTDPKLADAIFSDRIGEAFEDRLSDILPNPEPVAKPAPPEPGPIPAAAGPALPTETVNKLSNPAKNSSFGRGKGTIFLVDPKSHEVLWSVYLVPKSSESKDLDRTASEIVSRLKHSLKPQ